MVLTTPSPAPTGPDGRWSGDGRSGGRFIGRFVAHVLVFAVLAVVPLLPDWRLFTSDLQRVLIASSCCCARPAWRPEPTSAFGP